MTTNITSLRDRWALVTGASRGIGQQIAVGLAQQGCHLVLHSRESGHNAGTAALLSNYDVRVHSTGADLGAENAVDALIDEIHKAGIGIDILYNNAAIMPAYHDDPFTIDPQVYRQVMEVNLVSLTRLCYAFMPGMIERGWGRVVNLGSGIEDLPELAPYAVSKAAVKKFTRDFAKKLEQTGVCMNTLDPGWLKTDMGGHEAPFSLDSVMPGALMPVLLKQAGNGHVYSAQAYSGKTLDEAIALASQFVATVPDLE